MIPSSLLSWQQPKSRPLPHEPSSRRGRKRRSRRSSREGRTRRRRSPSSSPRRRSRPDQSPSADGASPTRRWPGPWSFTRRAGTTRTRSRRPQPKQGDDEDKDDKPKAEASMFYTAYFRNGAPAANRPITFLFNGGPGSSTVWLHMGAFGPVAGADRRRAPHAGRALCRRQQRPEPARRQSDLVFIDAPGTGFSRIAGKDKEKAFYGVDQDIDAFTQFITSVPVEVRPLELAQICVRRKLWHDARRGPRAGAAEQGRRPQRPDPALRHPQLGPPARRSADQSRHRHALHRLAADLCGDGLVSQPGRRPAGGLADLPRPGRRPSRRASMRSR